jgi:DNA-binding transcriptional LysR family regulator
MNIKAPSTRVDLNLFRVFDAIWRSGSLTIAAEQLHLTQPAVSNALARLREHFDDPLFQRRGRRMSPTPRAQAMAADVSRALFLLRESVQRAQPFEPAQSTRSVNIGLRDTFEVSLLPQLAQVLQQQAPRMRLNSQAIDRRRMVRQLADGELDFVFDAPFDAPDDIRQAPLLQVEFRLAMSPDHPFAHQPPTVAQWASARHAVVSGRVSGPVMEDIALQREGFSREVSVRMRNYYAACQLVASTDLLVVLPRFYGEWFQRLMPLHLAPAPLPLPPLPILLYWHRNADSDAGHAWLRERILTLFGVHHAAADEAPDLADDLD